MDVEGPVLHEGAEVALQPVQSLQNTCFYFLLAFRVPTSHSTLFARHLLDIQIANIKLFTTESISTDYLISSY